MAGPTADPFSGALPAFGTTPYAGAFAITAGTAFAFPTRAIWVGSAGALNVTFPDGSSATLSAIPAGTLLPIRAASVASSGTTAGSLVGLY